MTPNNEENFDGLKEEVQALRKQMESLAKDVEKNASSHVTAMTTGLEEEFDRYRKMASDKLRKSLDVGHDEVEKISKRIRQNPLGSLLLAFGAGYLLSRLFRHSR